MPEVTLKERAYQELRRLIINGELKQGEFLTERSLAEKLEMSRTPIRSAVERLESEGLVSYTPNKGIFISEMSLNKVVDFFDFRMAIESYVVRKLAIQSLSEEDRSWFEENLGQQQDCLKRNDYSLFTELDSEFHRKLARVYGNSEVIQVMERLQDKLFQIALKVLRKDNSRIHASYNDHVHIYGCILKGDPDEASKEIIQHLEFGKRILLF